MLDREVCSSGKIYSSTFMETEGGRCEPDSSGPAWQGQAGYRRQPAIKTLFAVKPGCGCTIQLSYTYTKAYHTWNECFATVSGPLPYLSGQKVINTRCQR